MPSASFDVLGTCFTFASPINTLHTLLPTHTHLSRALFFTWFYSSQRDFTYLSMSGRYTPIAEILRATFVRNCLTLGIPAAAIPSDAVDRLMHSIKELDAQPGLKDAWERLRAAGWDCIAVTNGGAQTSLAYFERAGVNLEEQDLLSCDTLRVAKPDTRVYENAVRVLGEREGSGGRRWFVAAHAWDLVAAREKGFKTAFLRFEEHEVDEGVFGRFDVVADGFEELVEGMLEAER